MKKVCLLVSAAVLAATALAQTSTTIATSVTEHEETIYEQEQIVDDKQEEIKVIDGKIKVLKERVDSLNKVEKGVKSQISELEKQKKALQNDIKVATKAREVAFDQRDNLVYESEVLDVLQAPYNKLAVDEALKSFDGMETKDVLKKKELVENYGKYTAELRDLLAKQKSTFAKAGWTYLSSESEQVKKFHKALKGTKYYKVYEKGMKNTKNATIPYLDSVIESILQLERSGFNSEKQYDAVVGKLY